MLAAIPYTTFPDIELGPLTLQSFGLLVGIGVLLGAWVAAIHGERFGIPREETYKVGTRMVLAGVVGARLTWVASHLDQIDNPIDVIAVWEGGLQFSGGFVAAIIVGFPTFRRWSRLTRWRMLDGYAMGLALGLGIGRIGCYSVGEHFGAESSFFLATRYEGGDTREQLGDEVLMVGDTFHNLSLYEMLYLLVLFVGLAWLLRLGSSKSPRTVPGVAIGVFCLYYAFARGGTDFLRVNDETVLGLTGAQYLCLLLIPVSIWMLTKVRRTNAELVGAESTVTEDGLTEDDADEAGQPDVGHPALEVEGERREERSDDEPSERSAP